MVVGGGKKVNLEEINEIVPILKIKGYREVIQKQYLTSFRHIIIKIKWQQENKKCEHASVMVSRQPIYNIYQGIYNLATPASLSF